MSDNNILNVCKSEISMMENFKRKISFKIPFLFEIKTILDWTIN